MKNMHSHERDAKIIHLCAHTKEISCLFMHYNIILIQINEFILLRINISIPWKLKALLFLKRENNKLGLEIHSGKIILAVQCYCLYERHRYTYGEKKYLMTQHWINLKTVDKQHISVKTLRCSHITSRAL